jgi:hypothetical protein
MILCRALAMLVAGSLAVACETTPRPVYRVEGARTFSQSKDVVWNRLLRFLEANDIRATRADRAGGVIQAERTDYQDAGWAECDIGWVIDNTSNSRRRGRPRPVDRDLALSIGVEESAGATTVTVDARFQEEQINPFRNLPFDRPCRSTGALESALLNAVEGATTPAPARAPESG